MGSKLYCWSQMGNTGMILKSCRECTAIGIWMQTLSPASAVSRRWLPILHFTRHGGWWVGDVIDGRPTQQLLSEWSYCRWSVHVMSSFDVGQAGNASIWDCESVCPLCITVAEGNFVKGKDKGAYSYLWNSPQNYVTPLVNGITQGYLPPDRGDRLVFTPTGQVGTRFIDPIRMKVLSWPNCLVTEIVYPSTDGHPSRY